jgi:hypothetical protein
MKLQGYGKNHAEGVTSLDGSDFFGTHLLICRSNEHGQLEPLMGYKSISLKRSQYFHMAFPGLATLKAGGAERFVPALNEIISNAERKGRDISFDSGWTKSPKIDKEFSKYLREIITTIGTLYHLESPVKEWLTCGIFRFKTDEYFKYLGAEVFTEPFGLASSADEKTVMLHLKEPSRQSIIDAEKHRALWNARIEITEKSIERVAETLKKAA